MAFGFTMIFKTIVFGSVYGSAYAVPTAMTANELFQALDSNGDGVITENEMLGACYTMHAVGPMCKSQPMCKIPMTHSFVGNWSVCEIALREKETRIREAEMKERASRERKYHKVSEYDNYYDNHYSRSSYQRGRDSIVGDIVDAAATYVIADTIVSVFSATLENKD